MAQPLFPILKPVLLGEWPGFFLVVLKMADRKDGVQCVQVYTPERLFQPKLVPSIYLYTSDQGSGRSSARCRGWGKGKLGTELFLIPENRSD